MTARHMILFIAAVALVGCKPADKTADATTTPSAATTTTDSTPAATTDSSTTTPAATTDDASKGSIVGTWTITSSDLAGSVEFKDDGTATMSGTSTEMKNVEITSEATYKLDGNKLTVKPTKGEMTPTADADDKTKKAVADFMKTLTPEFLAKQDPEVSTIAWKDKDTFTSTNDKSKKVNTYTRKAA